MSFKLFNEIKLFLIIFVIYVSLDLIMILGINKDMYVKNLTDINVEGKPSPTNTKLFGSSFGLYLLITFGIYYFCVKQKSYLNAVLLGLIVYGVYNATNVATITNYDGKVAAIDTAWGTSLFLITTILTLLISHLLLASDGDAVGDVAKGESSGEVTAMETTTELPSAEADLSK